MALREHPRQDRSQPNGTPRRRYTRRMTLNGFLPPLTPKGASSLVPNMPWYYSGTLLTVEYLTDPDNVRAILPDDIDLAPEEPGAVAIIWADWQSCSEGGLELLDPLRSQYLEAFVVVRCSYEGTVYSRCVAIWVTKDFAIARGWFQGYPKKLGSVHVTRIFNHGKATPRLEAGAKLGATLAAYDHRLASRCGDAARARGVERLRERAPDAAQPVHAIHHEGRRALVRPARHDGQHRCRPRHTVEGRRRAHARRLALGRARARSCRSTACSPATTASSASPSPAATCIARPVAGRSDDVPQVRQRTAGYKPAQRAAERCGTSVVVQVLLDLPGGHVAGCGSFSAAS